MESSAAVIDANIIYSFEEFVRIVDRTEGKYHEEQPQVWKSHNFVNFLSLTKFAPIASNFSFI